MLQGLGMSPTYTATSASFSVLRSRWTIPCTGWSSGSGGKSEPTVNELVTCSDAKIAGMLQGLGCFTPKEIVQQRKVNAAAGRGDFADAELELSARISAAPTPLVLRTVGGDVLKLDWP